MELSLDDAWAARADFKQLLISAHNKGSADNSDGRAFKACIVEQKGYEDLLYSVLDRDLGCGIKATTINKAIPDLIPVFDVALGEPIKRMKKVKGQLAVVDNTPKDLYDGKWLVSRKLDGIRCVAIKNEGRVACYTRQGRVFKTTALLEEALAFLPDGLVLDGELCVVDEYGNEDFKAIQSQWSRKDYTLEHFKYLVFDILTIDEFYGKTQSDLFSSRAENAEEFCGLLASPYVEAVKQEFITDKGCYEEWKRRARENGWEGLILRKDVAYKGQRSKDILKVKEFHDGEFKIIDIVTGPFTIRKGGRESVIDTVTAIGVEFKGNYVGVGSGFTLAEREDIRNNPEKYLGKKATIKYFEESQDEEGRPSLRFPVYKSLRTGGD